MQTIFARERNVGRCMRQRRQPGDAGKAAGAAKKGVRRMRWLEFGSLWRRGGRATEAVVRSFVDEPAVGVATILSHLDGS